MRARALTLTVNLTQNALVANVLSIGPAGVRRQDAKQETAPVFRSGSGTAKSICGRERFSFRTIYTMAAIR